MRFKPPHCRRLQGAADARRRARRRTFVLQVPDNKADAVPCERLHFFNARVSYIQPDVGLPAAVATDSVTFCFAHALCDNVRLS